MSVRDRRVDRTRSALLGAFRELLLAGTYDTLSVTDVIERANVGRSTFYEHFDNKDALFRESLTPLLTILATAVDTRPDASRIEMVVTHFGESRRLARAIYSNGSTRAIMASYLGQLIEERLQRGRRAPSSLPLPLKAMQIAEAQLGLQYAWIAPNARSDASAIRDALIASSQALARL